VAATGTGHSTPAALPERRPERRPFTAQASSIHSTPAALPECRSECRPERRPFESAGDAGLWPLINEGLASVRAPFCSLRPLQGGAQGSASAAPSAAPLRSPAVTPATGTRGTRVADEGGHQRCHQAPSWASSSETRGTRGLSNGGGSSGGGGGIGTRGGGGGRYPCSCGNGSCGRRRAAADVTNAKAHHVSHGSACGGGTSLLRMAEWHRLMRLQPGAPLYEGASSSMQVLLTAPLPFHRCACPLRGRARHRASRQPDTRDVRSALARRATHRRCALRLRRSVGRYRRAGIVLIGGACQRQEHERHLQQRRLREQGSMQRACMQRARQQRQHRLRLLLVGQAHAHGLDASAEVSCAMAARSAGGETTHAEHIKTCGRGVLALRTRPKPSVTQIAEPCGVCVSMCRAAVALSLALAPARRVWFAAGRAGSRSGTGNTTTRIIENRPEPRRDRAPGQHFIVPTAHTAEVNNCVCVIFLCLRLRTVRVELSALRLCTLQHTLSVPALPHD